MRDNITTPERGQTWYNGDTPDGNDTSFENVIGCTKVFEDVKWGDRGIKPSRTGQRSVVCRLLRNVSGITVYAKDLVQVDPTNPNHILGRARTTGQKCYPVDEFLPATGCPNNDLCWVVVKGPAIISTPMNGADFSTASIAAGAILAALTTSGGSTTAGTTASAGRVAGFAIVAATTVAQFTDLLNVAVNTVGMAMSAITSGQTNADILVDVGAERAGWP